MNDAMEHSWLHLLHINACCTRFLSREDYLVCMSTLSIMAFLFGIVVVIVVGFMVMVVLLGFLGMLMVMVVIEMVMGLASASDHSRHEDYR